MTKELDELYAIMAEGDRLRDQMAYAAGKRIAEQVEQRMLEEEMLVSGNGRRPELKVFRGDEDDD